ncbi:MAG: DUF1735 domain-containing protein [Bacteroidetes bacterium]|nr:DUF1735 domain-containing protein [Bacteroidota bacterium]
MKKRLYIVTAILAATAALSLSSCLKDPRYYTFSQGGTVINFPLGGLGNFGADAITDPGDTIVKQFSVDVASPNVPTTPTNVTIAVDNSIITSYNASNSAVTYNPMPDGSYVLSATKVTIPAGQRVGIITVTFYKNQLDPSQSYMLPIKIVSGNSGNIISGNFGVLYYHFIGNDFAGTYDLNWTRWHVAGDTTGAPAYDHLDLGTVTMSPVTPTTAQVVSGYYNNIPYTITFSKTGNGASATYSNFAVTFLAADISNYWQGAGITLGTGPMFDPAPDPNTQYTYAQAVKLFRFYYTTASRSIIDKYTKQ